MAHQTGKSGSNGYTQENITLRPYIDEMLNKISTIGGVIAGHPDGYPRHPKIDGTVKKGDYTPQTNYSIIVSKTLIYNNHKGYIPVIT